MYNAPLVVKINFYKWLCKTTSEITSRVGNGHLKALHKNFLLTCFLQSYGSIAELSIHRTAEQKILVNRDDGTVPTISHVYSVCVWGGGVGGLHVSVSVWGHLTMCPQLLRLLSTPQMLLPYSRATAVQKPWLRLLLLWTTDSNKNYFYWLLIVIR